MSAHTSSYFDGIHTQIRGGIVREFPAVTITESKKFAPLWSFDEAVDLAEKDLTSTRGWDLSAIPKQKIARFSQRSTNTEVSIYIESRKVQVVVSQRRYASVADRMRQWWKGLRL